MKTAETRAPEPPPSATWRFVRNVIDIVVFVALTFGLQLALAGLASKEAPRSFVIPLFGTALMALVLIRLLLRLQGQRFSDIGLGRPGNVTGTLLQGISIAVLLFAFATATEAMGFERDFSALRALLEGQPVNLMIWVVYTFVGAGLYEETTFRGFTLNRFARMFGEGRLAWALAAVLQGVLFGLGHGQQGLYGMFFTGALGVIFGFVFLLNGRNLWPLVIGHGLYDAARSVYFYVLWTYYP